jgi:hypothetical protein
MMKNSLRDSLLHSRLRELAADDTAARTLLSLTEAVFDEATAVTKSVVRYMPEYTLHDEQHLLGVVDLMGRLIPKDLVNKLTPLELAGLMLSAALHDIGMAPARDEVERLLAKGGEHSQEQVALASVAYGYPDLAGRRDQLLEEGRHSESSEIDAFFISEHLRKQHAARSRQYIFDKLEGKLSYADFNFAPQLADVCASHTEDTASLQALPCRELVRAPGEYCNWRFVAVVLRLADILDFDPKRTPPVLFSQLGVRNSVSIREWRKHQAITGWDIRPEHISFAAQCADPVIEKSIRDFIVLIDRELVAARVVISGMHDGRFNDVRLSEEYRLPLPDRVDTSEVRAASGPQGPLYEYVDLAFNLDAPTIKALLMGVRLYRERSIFLRELLQNAVDACRHRQAVAEQRGEPYSPEIVVRWLSEAAVDFIEVEDNGMGMDFEIIRDYFARLGKSYYSSPRFFEERGQTGLTFQPIAEFGIGVLSCFMVSDMLQVETLRAAAGSTAYNVEVAGEGALFWFRRGSRTSPGTKVTLRLTGKREEDPVDLDDLAYKWPPISRDRLASLVGLMAPHVSVPIRVESAKRNARVVSAWRLPDMRYEHDLEQYSKCMEWVDLDLARARNGVRGRIRVLLLRNRNGQFASAIRVGKGHRPGASTHGWDDNEPEHTVLEHSFSERSIDLYERERLERSDNWDPDRIGWSRGRWSQEGFAIPGDRTFLGFELSPHFPFAGFPLPLFYDVDVAGAIHFPLSADRKSVIPSSAAAQASAECSRVLAEALLKKLGRARVRRNMRFFDELAKSSKSMAIALRSFLGNDT